MSSARADRLRRELAKLDAGAVAELVVVTAGRSRTVRVTTIKASDLPGGGMTVIKEQLTRLASQGSGSLTIGLVIGVLVSLWSGQWRHKGAVRRAERGLPRGRKTRFYTT